ncbi:MAG TPA: YggT family protein [Spirochaetia bacterium]|nr:YggT family protein [Spirochaetia bacterium]
MQVLQVVYAVIIVYVLVLSLRIILGWFAPHVPGRGWEILRVVTDPYLDLFRRIRFLRGDLFDFSPIAAVLVLVLVADLIGQLLNYGRITVGFFLASAFAAAWSGARFLLLLFLIVGLLRTIPVLFPRTAGSGIWRVVDLLIQPVVSWVSRIFRLGPRAGYLQHLLLTIGLLFVAWLAGEYLFGWWGRIPYWLTLLSF